VPSLSIDPNSIVTTQVVDNFTFSGASTDPIALVQEKSTAIRVKVFVTNPKANDQTPMIVTVTLPDGVKVNSSPIPMANIDPVNGTQVVVAPVIPFLGESGEWSISSFVVTIQDVEGDTVTKTVTILAPSNKNGHPDDDKEKKDK